MPELPEVETVRRQLHERLQGHRVVSVRVLRTGREFPSENQFVRAVVGKEVSSVERRAKLLIWKFIDGTAMTAHLKMTGRFVFIDQNHLPQKHDRIVFEIGNERLVWSDVRQFGFLKVVSQDELERITSAYGPEPLDVSAETLSNALDVSSKRTIKAILLDQAILAGVGNIYADESLHRASIHPTRRVSSLSSIERLRLAQEIQTILRESIAQQGTSANDYVDTNGEKGGFLELLRVYGREGDPCRACGTPIKRVVVSQRGTHFCPTCQA